MNEQHLRILHISDTHNQHDQLTAIWEQEFGGIPKADVLIHTGDFTCVASDQEGRIFKRWLDKIKHHFSAIYIISGNHDSTFRALYPQRLLNHNGENPTHRRAVQEAYETFEANYSAYGRPDYFWKPILEDAGPDNNIHFLSDEAAQFEGLNFYGVSWLPWWSAGLGKSPDGPNPKGKGWVNDGNNEGHESQLWNRFQERERSIPHRLGWIPENTDALLCHFAPSHVLGGWGSSSDLFKKIQELPNVGVVAWGHIHSHRGTWRRDLDEPRKKYQERNMHRPEGWDGGACYVRDDAYPSEHQTWSHTKLSKFGDSIGMERSAGNKQIEVLGHRPDGKTLNNLQVASNGAVNSSSHDIDRVKGAGVIIEASRRSVDSKWTFRARDINSSDCSYRLCSPAKEHKQDEMEATPESPPIYEGAQKTWNEAAGRTHGGDGYQPGDINVSRTLVRKIAVRFFGTRRW